MLDFIAVELHLESVLRMSRRFVFGIDTLEIKKFVSSDINYTQKRFFGQKNAPKNGFRSWHCLSCLLDMFLLLLGWYIDYNLYENMQNLK